eukprot:UN28767
MILCCFITIITFNVYWMIVFPPSFIYCTPVTLLGLMFNVLAKA